MLNVVTIPHDRSLVDLDCHAFTIWGMKAIVVNVPAVNPSIVTPSIIVYTGGKVTWRYVSKDMNEWMDGPRHFVQGVITINEDP